MTYYNNPYMTNSMQPMNYAQPQQSSALNPPPQQDPVFKWVQGRAGAEAYPLAPGTSGFFMESDGQRLYAKASDSYGRYMPLQSYRLVPEEDQSSAAAQQLTSSAETIDYEKIRQIIAEEVSKQIEVSNPRPTKREGK